MRIHPLTALLGLAAVGVAVWLTAGASLGSPMITVLAMVNILLALIGIVRAVGNGLRPVAAVFFTFYFGWLGVAPVIQLELGRVAWGDVSALVDQQRVATGLLMTTISLVAFSLGAGRAFAGAEGRDSDVDSPAGGVQPVRGGVLLALIVAFAPVALYAISSFGLGTYFTSRNERRDVLAATGITLAEVGGARFAFGTTLPVALAVVITSLAVIRLQHRWRTKPGVGRMLAGDLAALLIGIAGIAVFANPLSQTRFIAGSAIASVLILLFKPKRRPSAVAFAGASLFATLLAYPLATSFRGDTVRSEVTRETFTSNDFDGFQQILNTLTYTQQFGHALGHHIVSAMGYFIPRSYWTGKADPASLEIAQYAGYRFTNLSLPIHAELYLQFWWLGPTLGMFILGRLAATFDTAYLREAPSRLALLAPYAALASLGLIRGPLGSNAPIYFTVLLLLWLGLRPVMGPQRARDRRESRTNQSPSHSTTLSPARAGLREHVKREVVQQGRRGRPTL